MARVKSVAALEAEIEKTKASLESLRKRYESMNAKLKQLEEKRRNLDADSLISAFAKSGRSLEEVMNFLKQ